MLPRWSDGSASDTLDESDGAVFCGGKTWTDFRHGFRSIPQILTEGYALDGEAILRLTSTVERRRR